MRIRYLKGDPRAGMVAEVHGTRAERLIKAGSAEKVALQTPGAQPEPSAEQKAVVKAAKKAVAKPAAKEAK